MSESDETPKPLSRPEFWKAAGYRALWTFAQTFIVFVGGNQTNLFSVDAGPLLLSCCSAALLSLMKSIAVGIPEVG